MTSTGNSLIDAGEAAQTAAECGPLISKRHTSWAKLINPACLLYRRRRGPSRNRRLVGPTVTGVLVFFRVMSRQPAANSPARKQHVVIRRYRFRPDWPVVYWASGWHPMS